MPPKGSKRKASLAASRDGSPTEAGPSGSAPTKPKGSTKWRPKKAKITEDDDENEQPPDVPVQEPRPSLQNRKAKLASQQALKNNPTPQDEDEDIEAGKTMAIVHGHAPLASLDNATETLRSLPKSVKRSVDPASPQTNEDVGINAFLLGAARSDRNYTSRVNIIETGSATKTKRWQFTAIDVKKNVRYFGTQPHSRLSATEAREIGVGLADILNHWPGALDDVSTNNYIGPGTFVTWRDELIIHAARVRMSSGTARVPIRCKAPTLAKNGPKNFRVDISLFTHDPQTFLPVNSFLSITQSNVSIDAVEDVPDGSLLLTYDNGKTWKDKDVPGADGKMHFKSNIDDKIHADAKEKFLAMEGLARSILLELQGKVMSKDTAKKQATRLIQMHGGKRRVATLGVADGAEPYVLEPNYSGRECLLYPSKAAENAGCTVKKGMSLPTADMSWFAPVVNVLNNTYKETGSMNQAFAAAAKINQAVLAGMKAGELPPSWCACDASMARTEEHTCTNCLRGVICVARVRSKLGLWVCKDCAGAAASKTTTAQTTGLVFQFLRAKLVREIRDEAKKRGLDLNSKVYQKNRDDCLKGLEVTLSTMTNGTQWKSALTGRVYTISATGSLDYGSFRPEDPSGDAIMPYSAFEDHWFIHTRDNIWIVELPLNMAKHVQIVPFMALLGRVFRAKEQEGLSASDLASIDDKAVKLSTRYRIIRLKAGYTQVARLNKPFKREKLVSDREEWISGKLRKNDVGPWTKYLERFSQYYTVQGDSTVSKELMTTWSDAEIEELKAVVARYEKEYGVKLAGKDDCPYFCTPSSMPDSWGWSMAFRVCVDRFVRMRDLCNIGCGTIDTPKTIFIFVVIILCILRCAIKKDDPKPALIQKMKDTFSEFLNLPLVLEAIDGFRMMFGHLIHGKAMWTGVHPVTFEFKFESCNVLLESCTSNYLKGNHPKSAYETLRGYVRAIQLDGTNSAAYDKSKVVQDRVEPQEVAAVDVDDLHLEIDEIGGQIVGGVEGEADFDEE